MSGRVATPNENANIQRVPCGAGAPEGRPDQGQADGRPQGQLPGQRRPQHPHLRLGEPRLPVDSQHSRFAARAEKTSKKNLNETIERHDKTLYWKFYRTLLLNNQILGLYKNSFFEVT